MPPKKTTNSQQQKKSPQKKAPAQAQSKKAPPKPQQKAPTRGFGKLVLPYVLCILAIVFAVITVLTVADGDVGAVGEGINAFACGLFGLGAFLFPLVLGYIGVKWCIHNVRWTAEYMSPKHEQYPDYLKAKKRLALSAIMSVLVLIMVCLLIGIIAEQDSFDISSFWSDGADLEGGGIFGGALACLFIMCFDVVVSIVIVVILLLIFTPLALGLTPNYIISKLSDKHSENVARKAEDREILAARMAEEREAEGAAQASQRATEKETLQKKAVAPMAAAAVQVEEREAKAEAAAKEMSVDELLADTQDVAPTPPPQRVSDELRMHGAVPIGPSEEQAQRAVAKPQAEAQTETPLDFGGDSFDTAEFDNINSILKGLAKEETKPAPVKAPAPEQLPIDLKEIGAEELLEDMAEVTPDESGDSVPEIVTPYVFPPIDFLTPNKNIDDTDHTEELKRNAQILVDTLRSFRVGVQGVTYSRGPTITRYELKPDVGIRVRSIANLVDDIALNLATSGVRIEAPIPGKAAVGIEVPNETRATVYLRDLIDTPKFMDSKSKLTAALGMDVGGNPIHFDIGKMPHLLIAGTTGSGKSICINCIIISILYKAKPEELKLILIDPKKVEFNMYKNIPHLYCPIVSEPKKAAGALASAVAEMERRFELIEQAGVRDIASYNAAAETDPTLEFMPHMVIIIDELADLMMTARDEVETSICRIAQKARAAGIHMILGTQRPSVDVITGLIKANVPSRIACTVMSQVDSRTIIDVAGAENLIGRGDMLFAPVGASKPMRVQGAFVSEGEIEKIVSFVKENNGQAKYNTEFINRIEEEAAKCGMGKKGAAATSEDIPEHVGGDSKFSEAVRMAIEEGKISTSYMQRRLGVGYGRAAKMIDTMEELGYVSKPDGNKPRRVLITMEEYSRRVMDGNLGDSE